MRACCVRAPGRVNLIGEHLDYCGGAVLPLALSLGVTVRATPRADGLVTIRSDAFDNDNDDAVAEIAPGVDPRSVRPLWARYAAGVLAALRAAGVESRGFDAEVSSDLPVGAGLASSAAFDVAFARAALRVSGADLDDERLVDVCRDAEQRASGVRCGIMDPYASLLGTPGHALLLDCATRAHRLIPVVGVALVVADSGVRHELAATEYNRRRAECEAALDRVRAAGRDVEHLVELEPEELVGLRLPSPLDRRVAHVVGEHLRVQLAVRALAMGDFEHLGRMLDASHASLRDLFEVSCPELDALVEAAQAVPGVYGSRMTGGGFGGCTVTAVRPERVPDLLAVLQPRAGQFGAFEVRPD